MLATGTMRLCNRILFTLLLITTVPLLGQAAPAGGAAAAQKPAAQAPLTVDRDPVRSPDAGGNVTTPSESPLQKQGKGYVLHTTVDEVVLNATVLDGHKLVPNLVQGDFQVYEDGVKQTILSFQHTDLPVSMGLVIDNSGSMYKKRPAVNAAALDLVQSSNPQDQAFVVNFSDESFLDEEFTSNVGQLRQGLSHIDSRGGTALYDAV